MIFIEISSKNLILLHSKFPKFRFRSTLMGMMRNLLLSLMSTTPLTFMKGQPEKQRSSKSAMPTATNNNSKTNPLVHNSPLADTTPTLGKGQPEKPGSFRLDAVSEGAAGDHRVPIRLGATMVPVVTGSRSKATVPSP